MPTELPKAATGLPALEPPTLLSANRTGLGVLLQWQPPEALLPPLTGFVLQARRDQGQWVIIGSNIHANQSEVLVQGLLRVIVHYSQYTVRHCLQEYSLHRRIHNLCLTQDSVYDLRLMSRSNKVLSEPSESVSVSTTGRGFWLFKVTFNITAYIQHLFYFSIA